MVTVVSVFLWEFLVICPLQHDSILKKTFQSKEFFQKWNDIEKPKPKSEKRELAKNKWYNQMAQVGTSWSMWNKRNKEKRVSRSTWNKWNKNKGVFRSTWNKWNKDKWSVQLNLSTCAKVGLQGRGPCRVSSSTERAVTPRPVAGSIFGPLSSQNSYWDCYGSFDEQRLFSVKFARFRNFSFWIHSGKFWNLGISNKLWDIQCWRKGRILINLCGKTNVRNCYLSQRDFFSRYRTVLGVAKGFIWSV